MSPVIELALADRGEDARADQAEKASNDPRTSEIDLLRFELAAGPNVGKEFEILRAIRRYERAQTMRDKP